MKRKEPGSNELKMKTPKIVETASSVQTNPDSDITQWNSEEILKKALSMIEEITKCAIDGKETFTTIANLYKLIVPVIHSVKQSSEMGHIIHWLIKFASPEIRESIVHDLLDDIDCMIRSKQASVCVQSMLECGDNKLIEEVVGSLLGNIVRYMNHPVSSSIIDLAYSKYASKQMKMFMRQELYGPMLRNIRDELIDELKEALIRFPLAKVEILEATKVILKEILFKKMAVGYSLFHSVLLDYFNECDEKDKDELINELKSSSLHLLNSKDGAFVILYMLEQLQFELKQKILEVIRPFIPHLCMSRESYIFSLGLFYSLNDVNLSRLYVVQKLLDNAETIASNEFGSCIFLYILAPESKLYLKNIEGKSINDILIEQKIVKYGLKNRNTLLLLLQDRLLFKIAHDAPKWLSNEQILSITEMALKKGKGYYWKDAVEAICSYIRDPFERIDEESELIWPCECKSVHDFIVKMIQYDIERDDGFIFSQSLVTVLNIENLSKWVLSYNGCSMLCALLKSGNASDILISHLSETNFNEKIIEYKLSDQYSQSIKK